METWLIIAVFGTIGVTALLIGVLYRLNGRGPRAKRGGDDGGVHLYGATDGGGRAQRQDADQDGSNDAGSDGGGDGGGGGGD